MKLIPVARPVEAGISPIVYHSTPPDRMLKILTGNKFFLTNSGFSDVEEKLVKQDYPFYLSTSRTRSGRYTKDSWAMFKLDGRKLAQKYSGKAIDYWGEEFRKIGKGEYEQEDRIYSKGSVIPNALNYILDITMWENDLSGTYGNKNRATQTLNILKIAASKSIPVRVYENTKDYVLDNKKKALNTEALIQNLENAIANIPVEPLSEYEQKYGTYDQRDLQRAKEDADKLDSFMTAFQIAEWVVANGLKERKEIQDRRKDLGLLDNKDVYDWFYSSSHDIHSRLTNILHTGKSRMTDDFVAATDRLARFMRKIKAANTKQLIDKFLEVKESARSVERSIYEVKTLDKVSEDSRAMGFEFDLVADVKSQYYQELKLNNFAYMRGEDSLTDQTVGNLFGMLSHAIGNIYYYLKRIEIKVTDKSNLERLRELFDAIGFNDDGGGPDFTMNWNKFQDAVHSKYPATASSFDQENEHQNTLNETGFWGRKGAGCLFFSKKTATFLIAHRSDSVEQPNTWGTFGGALDQGESFKKGIAREIKEETGFTGRYTLVPVLLFKHPSGFQYQNYIAVVDEEFKPKLDWENQGYKWCEWEDFPEPLHPGMAALMKHSKSFKIIKSLADESKQVIWDTRPINSISTQRYTRDYDNLNLLRSGGMTYQVYEKILEVIGGALDNTYDTFSDQGIKESTAKELDRMYVDNVESILSSEKYPDEVVEIFKAWGYRW